MIEVPASILALILSAFTAAHPEQGKDEDDEDRVLIVNVTNEAGEPVREAEAFLITARDGIAWPLVQEWVSADGEGSISLTPQYHPKLAQAMPKLGPYEGYTTLITRAPGYAWRKETIEIPAAGPVEVTLASGVPLRLAIRSADLRPVPETLRPSIVTPQFRDAAWLGQSASTEAAIDRLAMGKEVIGRFTLGIVEPLDGGEFVVRVPQDRPSVLVVIDEPGYLRYFESPPFAAEDTEGGTIELELPAPAALSVTVEPDDDSPAEYSACNLKLSRTSGPGEAEKWIVPLEERYRDSRRFETRFEHLAPGTYFVEARTGTRETRFDMDRPDYFITFDTITLGPGETGRMHFVLKTYDEEFYRRALTGDHDLAITIRDSDGELAAGEPYEAFVQFLHFGHFSPFGTRLMLSEGHIPADGTILLKNLRTVPGATLIVEVDGQYLGKIPITDADRQELAYTLPARIVPKHPPP